MLQVHCKLSVSHIKEAYVTSTTRTQRFPVLCLFRCAAFYTFRSWPESTAAGQNGRLLLRRPQRRLKRDGAPPMHTAPERGQPSRQARTSVTALGMPTTEQRTALDTKMHQLIWYRCRQSIRMCVQSAKCYSKMVRSKRSFGICTQQYTLPSAREKGNLTLCLWLIVIVSSANNPLSPL